MASDDVKCINYSKSKSNIWKWRRPFSRWQNGDPGRTNDSPSPSNWRMADPRPKSRDLALSWALFCYSLGSSNLELKIRTLLSYFCLPESLGLTEDKDQNNGLWDKTVICLFVCLNKFQLYSLWVHKAFVVPASCFYSIQYVLLQNPKALQYTVIIG